MLEFNDPGDFTWSATGQQTDMLITLLGLINLPSQMFSTSYPPYF